MQSSVPCVDFTSLCVVLPPCGSLIKMPFGTLAPIAEWLQRGHGPNKTIKVVEQVFDGLYLKKSFFMWQGLCHESLLSVLNDIKIHMKPKKTC